MSNIVSFRAKNFRSYKDEREISFLAIDDDFSSDNSHIVELEDGKSIKLLNSAVIYGANAAGKSNAILALSAFSFFVRESVKFDDMTEYPYEYFKFDKGKRNSPIIFTIDFIVDKKYLRYSFSYTASRFTKESLDFCQYTDGEINEKTNVFSRDSQGIVKYNKDYIKDNKFVMFETVRNKQLVLSVLGVFISDIFVQDIYKELRSIVAYNQQWEDFSQSMQKAIGYLQRDADLFQDLNRLITIADTGISEIKIFEGRIYARHNAHNFSEYLDLETEESFGTKTLLIVGYVALMSLRSGNFLAYDEINIALHPQLFKLLVSLFHDPVSNPKNAQILFTTHDTSIVQNNYMRIDQIWFAEKNEDGETELFSAQDFKDIDTISVPFEAWYRIGRFGATPNISKDIEFIINGGISKERAEL